jgi:hypothetical protein
VQAVKHWRAGTRRIDSVSLLNMARQDDSVWAFVCEQAGRAEALRRTDAEFHADEIERIEALVNEAMRRRGLT